MNFRDGVGPGLHEKPRLGGARLVVALVAGVHAAFDDHVIGDGIRRRRGGQQRPFAQPGQVAEAKRQGDHADEVAHAGDSCQRMDSRRIVRRRKTW